jgi:hypothetical protein
MACWPGVAAEPACLVIQIARHQERTVRPLMPVIEDHPPFGLGVSARCAGDRGAERPVLEPHDHLHDKQTSAPVGVAGGVAVTAAWTLVLYGCR